MKLPLLFKIIFSGILAFLFVVIVTLINVSIPDYLEDVKGVVISDTPPSIIFAEKQYRIKHVYANKNAKISKGESIIDFVDTQLEATVDKLKFDLNNIDKELELKYQQKSLVEEKILTTESLILKRSELKSVKSQRLQSELVQQKRHAKSNATLVALSESLQQDVLKKLNSDHLSTMDKIDILTKSNDKLQSNELQKFNIENTDSLIKESNLVESIDVEGLKRTLVSENIELNQINLNILNLESKKHLLNQEYQTNSLELLKLSIQSPIDGEVMFMSDSLHQSNIVTANEHLITILPLSNQLEVELTLTDKHHKDIRVGQEVHMQLHAWNHYKHGIIKGQVTDVSKGKNRNHINGNSDFIAKVALDSAVDEKVKFGYTLTAKVVMQDISLFAYILKKLSFKG